MDGLGAYFVEGRGFRYTFTPKTGYVYLLVDLEIENSEYDSLSVSGSRFSVVVDSVKYDDSFASYTLSAPLPSVKVLKGGIVRGSVAFEVPSNVSQAGYLITYESYSWESYSANDIEWQRR